MAWTKRYVSVAGAGAHDGTDDANSWTLAEAIAAPITAGMKVNIKAGTYANTTTGRTFATAGTTTAPVWLAGYKATEGDLDDGIAVARSLQDGVNLPLITFTTGQMIVSGAHHTLSNLDITSQCTTTNGALVMSGGNYKLIMCRVENTAANSAARALTTLTASTGIHILCRFKATTTAARCITNNVSTAGYFGCHIIGGIIGLYGDTNMEAIDNCVVSGFTTTGITTDAATLKCNIINCTIYAAGTNGINIATIPTTGSVTITNCIIGGCTNGVNAASATNGPTLFRNHFYACTNNLVNITELGTVGADLGILCRLFDEDTDPFVNKASADFSLADAAIDRAAGFPGVFEGQTAMVGYPDIGAVAHAENEEAAGGRPEFRGSNL